MALDLEMLLTYLEGLQSHIAHVVKRFEKDVYWEDRVHSRKLYRLLQAPISAMRTMKNHEVLREVESAQDLVNIVAEMAYQFDQLVAASAHPDKIEAARSRLAAWINDDDHEPFISDVNIIGF